MNRFFGETVKERITEVQFGGNKGVSEKNSCVMVKERSECPDLTNSKVTRFRNEGDMLRQRELRIKNDSEDTN